MNSLKIKIPEKEMDAVVFLNRLFADPDIIESIAKVILGYDTKIERSWIILPKYAKEIGRGKARKCCAVVEREIRSRLRLPEENYAD